MTDCGVVIGIFDEDWPHPTDDSRGLWAFVRPTLNKETPRPSFDDVVFGICAVTGDRVVD